MNNLVHALNAIIWVASIGLCLFVGFFQTSKSNGMSTITGEGLQLFANRKLRGVDKRVQNIVIVLTVILLVCVTVYPLVLKMK